MIWGAPYIGAVHHMHPQAAGKGRTAQIIAHTQQAAHTGRIMLPRLLVLHVAAVAAAACNRTQAFSADTNAWTLASCTELDLSCPAPPATKGRGPLCDNALRQEEIASLAAALQTTDAAMVTAIRLGGALLGAAGAVTLAPALAALPALQSLGLSSCRIGDVGAKTLAKVLLQPRTPPTLQRVELRHNGIADDGVRAIADALKDGSPLRALDLSWNAIGTRGGRYLGAALKETSGPEGLQELDLGWNGLGARGARALGEGLGSNGALLRLHAPFNAIKDDGCSALAKGLRTNAVLQTLGLEHNGISDGAMEELNSALAAEAQILTREASGSAGSGARAASGTPVAANDDDDSASRRRIVPLPFLSVLPTRARPAPSTPPPPSPLSPLPCVPSSRPLGHPTHPSHPPP